MRVGPIICTPKPPTWGARASAISSLKMNCSPGDMPAPPYSFGQCGAIQPRAASDRRHCFSSACRSGSSGSTKAASSSGVQPARQNELAVEIVRFEVLVAADETLPGRAAAPPVAGEILVDHREVTVDHAPVLPGGRALDARGREAGQRLVAQMRHQLAAG